MTGELQQLNDAREVSQVDEGDIGDSISMNDIPFGPYPSPLFYDEENNSSCTSSSSCDSDSSDGEEVSSKINYPTNTDMIRMPIKTTTGRFDLFNTTIEDVKDEVFNQFGLYPSQYILKAGYKVLAKDNCLLSDYNMQENDTLDIVLRANHHLLGGTYNSTSEEMAVEEKSASHML